MRVGVQHIVSQVHVCRASRGSIKYWEVDGIGKRTVVWSFGSSPVFPF